MRRARPVVVTGATDRGSWALAAREYLVKPVELQDLATAIRRRAAQA